MSEMLEKIIGFDEVSFRNTVGIDLDYNCFDDLSDDPKDWAEAAQATDFSNRFSISDLQYNAIDYVFCQKKWHRSRFGNGSFPVWYGSMELVSTFHETAYHWRCFINDATEILSVAKGEPILHARTVFNVTCQSTLVDLREKATNFPFLISKKGGKDAQSLGAKLSGEGFPGLVSQSARYNKGTNLVIFRKEALSSPSYQGDYLYQLDPMKAGVVEVLDYKTKKTVATV